ncbi:MAG: rhodanese-like domain-containing protein [Nitrospinota bacterium]|nr:rhodanese-like domain-containing protein [Nitrospinota bacterium]
MSSNTFENPEILLSPKKLRELIGGQKPPNLVIIDTRSTPEFCNGHVEGAAHLDLYGISLNDTSPKPLKAFTWMLAYLMEIRGVDYDKTVVFYEENSGMRSARGFWFLEYLCHENVHILDVGITAWKKEGYPVTTEPWPLTGSYHDQDSNNIKAIVRTSFTDHLKEADHSKVASAEYILENMGRSDIAIHDTRSEGEFYGETVRAARGGAIPNSIHLEWVDFVSDDGFVKPPEELRVMLEEKNLTNEKEIIPLCQGGYRSAYAYLIYRLLGYTRVRNYIGSWKEWGDRKDLPIITPKR